MKVSEREFAKKMLVSIGIAIANTEKLMESESEEVRIFALDAFTKLAEIEFALLTALGFNVQSEDRNPLVRRLRLDG